MKLLVIFVLCVVAASGEPPKLQGGLQKRIMGYASACRKEGNVPPEEITLLMQRKIPTSEKGKCFLFCIQKKLGIQGDDGKKNEASIKAYIEETKKSDADFGEKIEKITTKCWGAVDQTHNPCDIAAEVSGCYMKTMQEVGLKAMR